MTKAEQIIAAYYCSDDVFPNNRCKECPFGYGYLDDSGDHSFWWCDEEKITKDAVELLSTLTGPKRVEELKQMAKEYSQWVQIKKLKLDTIKSLAR